MQPGIRAGKALSKTEWLALCSRAIFDFFKWDVQSEDHSVLADFPILVETSTAEFLEDTAEQLAREALAAEKEILNHPNLVTKLRLPRKIVQALQIGSGPECSPNAGVRVMRFDFHFTSEGWRISEVNADVPGGFIESSGWNKLFAASVPGATIPVNTSELYCGAVRAAIGSGGAVAMVHATAYSDDRQVMQHLAHCLSAQGLTVHAASPAHIAWTSGSQQRWRFRSLALSRNARINAAVSSLHLD